MKQRTLPTTPAINPHHDPYPPAWRTPRAGGSVIPSTGPAEADSPLAGGDCGAQENPSLKPGEQATSKSKTATNQEPQREAKTDQQKQEQPNQSPMELLTLEKAKRHLMTPDIITSIERNIDPKGFPRHSPCHPGGSLAMLLFTFTKCSSIHFPIPSFNFPCSVSRTLADFHSQLD